MSQQAATQRSRRQTAPSGMPLELKAKQIEKLDTVPDDADSMADVQNELEFNEWYNDLEATLLESSYDEYQYISRQLLGIAELIHSCAQGLSRRAPDIQISS
jgi:hypothetical protein